jgi:hypothetical protein
MKKHAILVTGQTKIKTTCLLEGILLAKYKRFHECSTVLQRMTGHCVCAEMLCDPSSATTKVLDWTWRCREGQELQDTGGLDA